MHELYGAVINLRLITYNFLFLSKKVMTYKVIGLMSGSSLDGLDIAFVHFHEQRGQWDFEIREATCYPYESSWQKRLQEAAALGAREYVQLHADYGHYLGRSVNRFIEEKGIHLQVDMVASHGHTVFHSPAQGFTSQVGDGAALAAETGLAVISDLRNLDVALGGQGAPIVPRGEALLFGGYDLLLNLGGIANLTYHNGNGYIAFDVCAANRVLNMLAAIAGHPYDDKGQLAASGQPDQALLDELAALPYYRQAYPKSLDNGFGISTVFPLVNGAALPIEDKLRTYTEHIAVEIAGAVRSLLSAAADEKKELRMLITGGGALNDFLIDRINAHLEPLSVKTEVPSQEIVQYKEAVIMGLLGVLRWREEHTTFATVTGARRDSIGGVIWLGQGE